jgi:hypothetical protein
VASCGVFLAYVAGNFLGGLRLCDSTLGRHDIINETFEIVAATDKLLFRNVDGGFITAFFPLWFVCSVPMIALAPVRLPFVVCRGWFLVPTIGTGRRGLFSAFAHDEC